MSRMFSFYFLFFFFFLFWLCHVACGILVPWPETEPVPPAVEVHSLNHWTAREFPLLFSSSSFSVSGLMFKSLIHFEFIFLIWHEIGVQLHSSACGYPVYSTPFIWRDYLFPVVYSWHPYWRLIDIDSWIYFWILFSVSLVCMSLCQYHTVLITVAL